MNKNRLAGRFAAGLALLMLSSACQSAPNPTPLPSDVPSQSKESVSTPEPTLTEPEIPTFFFSNFELDVKKESQAQLISFFDLAEGCTVDNPKELREPDAALSSLIQQLVEAINTRNTDLYNSLFAQEEARLDRLPVMPEIQEYTIHPQADFTLVDLTWLDCDQTLHSQYWLTLDKTHDLKIDRLREIPDCADRSTVSMGHGFAVVRLFCGLSVFSKNRTLLSAECRNLECGDDGIGRGSGTDIGRHLDCGLDYAADRGSWLYWAYRRESYVLSGHGKYRRIHCDRRLLLDSGGRIGIDFAAGCR